MSETLSHRGYAGSVEYSREDNMLCGKVLGIRSLLLYEGNSVQGLKEDFEGLIDEYLAECEELGVEPE